jgi:hypothetical protein
MQWKRNTAVEYKDCSFHSNDRFIDIWKFVQFVSDPNV